MKLPTTCLLVLLVGAVNAQITFQRTIGGTWADNNECMNRTTGAITTVPGSGYAICHTSQCFGPASNSIQPSVYFVRLNVNGDTTCTRTYSTTSNAYGRSVFSLNDGGFILGAHFADMALNGLGLIRINNMGDTLWTRAFPATQSSSIGYFGMPVYDGGFLAAGETYVGMGEGGAMAKVTANGTFVFGKSYVPSLTQHGMFFYGTCQTQDHCILATGSYHYNNTGNIVIMKADSAGNVLWTKSYEGTDYQTGYQVMELPDRSIMVTGDRISGGFGDYDAVLLKTDSAGNPLFEKIYGDSIYQWTNSMVLRSDGTIMLCGLTETVNNMSNAVLLNVDQNGVIQWTRRYGGWDLDLGNSLTNADDGGIAFTGFAYSFGAGNSDIYLVKTDANGLTNCYTNPVQYLEDTISVTAYSRTLTVYNNLQCRSANCTSRSGGIETILCTTLDAGTIEPENDFTAYPNPASQQIVIQGNIGRELRISIVDVTGKEVLYNNSATIESDQPYPLDISSLSSGTYFLRVSSEDNFIVRKLVVQRNNY